MTDEYCIHELLPDECSVCRPPKPSWQAPRGRRPTTVPRSADDPIQPLRGTKDVSMPVHAVGPYLDERTDWMPAMNGYPHDLRPDGWLYLRLDGRLVARVTVPSMGWRDERPARTSDDPNSKGWGEGLVFSVDPSTWEPVDQDLGEDAERMRQGYRYHWTDEAGVAHYVMKDDPVPTSDP
jgi:hypothetical protein